MAKKAIFEYTDGNGMVFTIWAEDCELGWVYKGTNVSFKKYMLTVLSRARAKIAEGYSPADLQFIVELGQYNTPSTIAVRAAPNWSSIVPDAIIEDGELFALVDGNKYIPIPGLHAQIQNINAKIKLVVDKMKEANT